MNWNNPADKSAWSGEISNRAAKEELGRRIAENVKNGQVIGVGSGSTSWIAIHAIAERVRGEGLSVTAVCTSQEVTMACIALDLPVASLLQRRPDWAFDGADEVDPDRNLIKGRGGAMFMEKVVMHASPRNFILVDESKLVTQLGAKFPIPIEVLPAALRLVERELTALGAVTIALRPAIRKDGPVITEHGNFILDVRFAEIHKSLERDIKAVPGVIESGLFIGRNVEILIAKT
ncbi:MAG TPA: ribose 5-phosphate isomerase A [Bryobacteraceae bacterium]|jgi:ribose 5-phosphate isomerase A